MHLLLLTPQIPYPPRQGASLRNYYIIRGLSERHDVTLLSFRESQQKVDVGEIAPLLEVCAGGMYYSAVPERTTAMRLRSLFTSTRPDMAFRLASADYEAQLVGLLQERPFDIVQIEGLELAHTIPLIRQHSPTTKVIFDNHNAETELQRRTLATDWQEPRRWLAAGYSAIQVVKLNAYEDWACQAADAVTVVSEADARHLQAQLPRLRPTVIPNCIDTTEYENLTIDPRFASDLLFVGKMDYRPNVDGMTWFLEEIWPQIIAKRPQTTLAIVGQKPTGRLRTLGEMPNVTITGMVESVEPYLAAARVVILPLRMGSGTRLKFLEACAASKPIVSTYVGAEGFAVEQGKQAFLADEPEWFAQYALSLLNNPEGAQKLGQTARLFARQYDWRQVVPRFEKVYRGR